MINPGYTAIVRDERPEDIDAGPVIRCPKCKRPLMEAVTLKVLTRCKFCKKWVFLKKT